MLSLRLFFTFDAYLTEFGFVTLEWTYSLLKTNKEIVQCRDYFSFCNPKKVIFILPPSNEMTAGDICSLQL